MIDEQILKTIRENLPSAVAGELKTFIEEAEKSKKELDALTGACERLESKVEILQAQESKWKDLEKREADIKEKEVEQKIKEQALELREQHAKERVDEIRGLTETVFRSNRLGYNLNFDMPVKYPKDQYGAIDYNAYGTERVTGELETKE